VDFTVLRDGNALLKMWATDLAVGPSLALASFQLFDFLAAGEFAAREGIYTVQSGASSATSTGDLRPDSAGNEGALPTHAHLAERCFVSCETLQLEDAGTGFENVLAATSAVGAGFDMAVRCGAVLSVYDRLRAGCLGIVAVGGSHAGAMAAMVRALEVLLATAAASPTHARTSSLHGLLSSLKFLASRLDPLSRRVHHT
jgi:hypothetical protein